MFVLTSWGLSLNSSLFAQTWRCGETVHGGHGEGIRSSLFLSGNIFFFKSHATLLWNVWGAHSLSATFPQRNCSAYGILDFFVLICLSVLVWDNYPECWIHRVHPAAPVYVWTSVGGVWIAVCMLALVYCCLLSVLFSVLLSQGHSPVLELWSSPVTG